VVATNNSGVQTRTAWQIDPAHSLVEFSGKHMVFATVKGRFQSVKGEVLWDEANPEASTVSVEIDVASLTSGNEQRDGHLKSPDFLEVEKYPTITFQSVRVEPRGADRAKVVGNLTIRDVTRPVELEAELTGRGRSPFNTEVAGFAARTQINRKEFGLNWNVALEAGGVLVGDRIDIAIDVETVKQS
jgi:polyisoprenoid-binding protein YceI